MINKEHIDVSQLEKLSIIQLNKLVQFMNMDKYYKLAAERTLIYNKYVMEEIAQYCNMHNMIKALNIRMYPAVSKDLDITIDATGYTLVGVTFDEDNNYKWFDGKQPVDALFEVVLDNLHQVIYG